MSAWRAARAMRTGEAACRATPDPASGAALAAAPARAAGLRSAAANWLIEVVCGRPTRRPASCAPRPGIVSPKNLLKRNGEQRIDLAAVEDDGFFGEKRRSSGHHHLVEVASGREQRGLAGVHDARDH